MDFIHSFVSNTWKISQSVFTSLIREWVLGILQFQMKLRKTLYEREHHIFKYFLLMSKIKQRKPDFPFYDRSGRKILTTMTPKSGEPKYKKNIHKIEIEWSHYINSFPD